MEIGHETFALSRRMYTATSNVFEESDSEGVRHVSFAIKRRKKVFARIVDRKTPGRTTRLNFSILAEFTAGVNDATVRWALKI